MSTRSFLYALFVTVMATWTSWSKMLESKTERSGGSSWNSGGRTGGGWGGGGHK